MPQREHLRRLSHVWLKNPLYFVTLCCAKRRQILNQQAVADLLIQSWHDAASIHGWVVGRYVIMPDHVHFFTRAQVDAKTLSAFMRDWKKWTTRGMVKVTNLSSPLWQSEYFDHVLRSAESYSEKWDYIRENPVRANLVTHTDSWPYIGECETLQF